MLAIVPNLTPGGTYFVLVTRASDRQVWSTAVKGFAVNPADAFSPTAECPTPNPPGKFVWQDNNVPPPLTSDNYFLGVYTQTAPGIYSQFDVDVPIHPPLGPFAVVSAPFGVFVHF